MKLLKLELSDLFGAFNHIIECNQDEGITILTAPNGYGKTISLKVIYNLFNKQFSFFDQLNFKKIIFFFDSKDNLEIIKTTKGVQFKLKDHESWVYTTEADVDLDSLPHYIEKINPDTWMDERDGEILYAKEVMRDFGRLKKIPEHFDNIINSLEVYLIQDQRLVIRQQPQKKYMFGRKRQPNFRDAIQKHSEELKDFIGKATTEYAQKTQILDSSFPNRLFDNNINYDDLSSKLSNLQDKQKRISKYGLLELEENVFLQQPEIHEKDKKLLSLYISDNEKKLSVFDQLVDGIELFVKILNERRFNFKKIEINKEDGFAFKTKNDEKLKPIELSSGEQHEVILLFELLFNAKENSLVLIDEPEMSLHVVWQKAFLDDIKEITKLRKIDVIIATHSPQIINEHWDLTVSLNEQAE